MSRAMVISNKAIIPTPFGRSRKYNKSANPCSIKSLPPQSGRAPESAAVADYNIATVELRNGNLQAALAAFERSLGFRSALVAAHPSVIDFQENLGVNLAEIAQVEYREDKARRRSPRSGSRSKSSRGWPIRSRISRVPGRAGSELECVGLLHDEIRDNALAIADFERAIAEQERAVAAFPG